MTEPNWPETFNIMELLSSPTLIDVVRIMDAVKRDQGHSCEKPGPLVYKMYAEDILEERRKRIVEAYKSIDDV